MMLIMTPPRTIVVIVLILSLSKVNRYNWDDDVIDDGGVGGDDDYDVDSAAKNCADDNTGDDDGTMGDADDYASEDDGRFRFDDKCCSIGLKCIKFGFSLKIKRNNSLVICTSYPHSTYALVEDIDN